MTESEIQEILNSIREEEKPENLIKRFTEWKKAYKNGDCLGLDEMSAVAMRIAIQALESKSGHRCDPNKVEQAISYLAEVRDAIVESKTNILWPQALIRTYPMMAMCYIELEGWMTAEDTINEYIVHLIDLFDDGGIPWPFNEGAEIDRLYRIVEAICNRYSNQGDTKQAIEYMLSAWQIISFGEAYTQVKYYTSLENFYRAIGDTKNAEEARKELDENYRIATSDGRIPV